MANPPTRSIGPFPLGMDNRAPDFKLALPEGAGHLLRDAVNVDVTQQGTIKTRDGFSLAESGIDCHSAWAPLDETYGLYCDSGDIFRVDVRDDGTTVRSQVATGYGRIYPVVYAQVNEAVYFTDGVRVGSYHPVPGPTPAWLSAQPQKVGDVQFSRMPAGSAIAHHNGRLLVAVGSTLVYSEPFTPHLRDESRGWEMFPAQITCVVAVEAGVFVVADQTYFLPGGLPAKGLRSVLPYGAPVQQPSYRRDSKDTTAPGGAHWMSTRGVVSVNAAGEITNLQEQHVAMKTSGAAATLFRERDGMASIVAALSTPNTHQAAVGSYAEVRLVRKDCKK